VKLVQMPVGLLHLEEADLEGAGVEPGLVTAFRAYLPRALDDRRGLLILAAPSQGGHHLLMLLARRIGAALRDANIRLRDAGGDMRAGRQRLCYLPGAALSMALATPGHRHTLAREAACFVQDLDAAWSDRPSSPDWQADPAASAGPDALRSLIAERLAHGRPTFLQAAPDRLSPVHAQELRARLPVLEVPGLEAPCREAPGPDPVTRVLDAPGPDPVAREAVPGRTSEGGCDERADLGTTV
jgi:hypothetical protein